MLRVVVVVVFDDGYMASKRRRIDLWVSVYTMSVRKGNFSTLYDAAASRGLNLWKVDLWKCGRQNFFHFTAFSLSICAYRHAKASRSMYIHLFMIFKNFIQTAGLVNWRPTWFAIIYVVYIYHNLGPHLWPYLEISWGILAHFACVHLCKSNI